MKKLLLLLVLIPSLISVVGQDRGEPRLLESIYYKSSSDIAPSDELPKVKRLIAQVIADSTMLLHLVGYDDNTKSKEVSNQLSNNRAAYLVEYIKSYGVPKERVSGESGGVDSEMSNSYKACRVDIYQIFEDRLSHEVIMPIVEKPEFVVDETFLVDAPDSDEIIDTNLDDSFLTKARFNVRTNLLYWLGGVINVGGEVKTLKSNFGFLIKGGYSPFGGADWKHSLGVWFVSPEVRYYLPRNPRWFMGLEAMCGEYNCKLTDTGYQGSILGGGVTAGYRANLNSRLDLEFTLGVGYAHLNYDTYYNNGEYNVVEQRGVEKGVVMPIEVGVNLVWKLGQTLANE